MEAMRLMILFGLASAAGFAALDLTSAAADEYAKLKALLPPNPAGAQACYARTYDKAHLAAHPKQKVTGMIFSLRYTVLGEDEAHLVAVEGGGVEKQYFDYDFTLAAKVRDRSKTVYASGDCTSLEGIGCGVDCDGGGVVLEPSEGEPGALLVRLDRTYSSIRMSLGCSEGEEVELEAGEDDKVFKLTKSPAALCDAMETDARK
jgi:hypothetical protein